MADGCEWWSANTFLLPGHESKSKHDSFQSLESLVSRFS